MSAWRGGAFRVGAWRVGSWRESPASVGGSPGASGGGGRAFHKWWKDAGLDLEIDELAERLLHPRQTEEFFAKIEAEEAVQPLSAVTVDMRLVDLMVESIKRNKQRQREEEQIIMLAFSRGWL